MDVFRKLFTAAFLAVAILPLSNSLAQALPLNNPVQSPADFTSSVAPLPAHKRTVLRAKFAQLSPAERSVVRDLVALARLYRRQGKLSAVEALYVDLLKRTQNPSLRQFAERRLAKAAVNKGDLASAEAHLRASLNAGLNQF